MMTSRYPLAAATWTGVSPSMSATRTGQQEGIQASMEATDRRRF